MSGESTLGQINVVKAATSDALAQQYTAMASDNKESEPLREAAMLFSVAESKLEEENFDDCEKSAREAAAIFQKSGSKGSYADALRLIVHAMRAKAEALKYTNGPDHAKVKEQVSAAEQLVEKELASFKDDHSKRGEAAMHLSWAEIHENSRDQKRLQDALQRALDAKVLASEVGDQKLQAHAAVVSATLLHKTYDSEKAMNLADEAAILYRTIKDNKGEAKALHVLSGARIAADQFEDGVQAAMQAVALYSQLGDAKQEGMVSLTIAQHFQSRNSAQSALRYAQDALASCKTLTCQDMRNLAAQAYCIIVDSLIMGGSTQDALRMAQDCNQLCTDGDVRDKRAEVLASSVLSRAYVALEDYRHALEAAEDAVSCAQAVCDSHWEAHCLRSVAQVHILVKNFDEAAKVGQEAAGLMQGVQDKDEEAMLLGSIGEVACERGDFESVLQTVQEQRALFQQSGNKSREASCLLAAASCIFGSPDRFDEAVSMVQEAMDLFEEIKEERGIGRAHRNLATMYKVKGDNEAALNSAESMRACFSKIEDRAAEAQAAMLLAEIHISRDNPAEAVRLANEAQSLARKAGDKRLEISAWVLVSSSVCESLSQKGAAALDKGRAKALKPAQEALSMAKKLNCQPLVAQALYQTASVQMLTGRIGDAMHAANEARSIFHAKGDEYNEMMVVMLMAEAQYAAGKEDRALEICDEAKSMAAALGADDAVDRAQKLVDKIKPPMPAMPAGGWVMAAPQQAAGAPAESKAAAAPSGGDVIAEAPQEQGLKAENVTTIVLEVAKNIIGSDSDIHEDSALMDSGLDSLSALSFRQTLSTQMGMKLPSSFVFDYPTVKEVTDRIVEMSKE